MTLTPQAIAGLLRRRGFKAAKAHTTGVRGWHETTEGFRCRLDYEYADGKRTPIGVSVSYHTGGHHGRPQYEAKMLVEIMTILTNEGYDVEATSSGSLLVKPKG